MADEGAGRRKGKGDRKARKPDAPRQAERPDGRRRAKLISAIDHPLRRRILRSVTDCREPRCPTQLSKELDEPVGSIAYHVQVLLGFNAVKAAGEEQMRGTVERFYESTIENDLPIETLLDETREVDDEGRLDLS